MHSVYFFSLCRFCAEFTYSSTAALLSPSSCVSLVRAFSYHSMLLASSLFSYASPNRHHRAASNSSRYSWENSENAMLICCVSSVSFSKPLIASGESFLLVGEDRLCSAHCHHWRYGAPIHSSKNSPISAASWLI